MRMGVLGLGGYGGLVCGGRVRPGEDGPEYGVCKAIQSRLNGSLLIELLSDAEYVNYDTHPSQQRVFSPQAKVISNW